MIIVADIGGSRTRIAASDASDSFEEPIVFDTVPDINTAVAAFTNTARDLAHGRPITGGIVGIAGLLSKDRATLLHAPHLSGWIGKDIVEIFSQALGAPVHFENDVALGALGEARFGAGAGASIMAYFAVGTGVNGARAIDGRLDRTTFGFEIGHQLLGADAHALELDPLVSGSGLEKKYGKPSSEITDPAIWNECADHFAYGLYNSILHWSPERVVLGGTLFNSKSISLERVKTTLRTIASALPELPDIRLAALGDRSGLYGALVRSNASDAQGG